MKVIVFFSFRCSEAARASKEWECDLALSFFLDLGVSSMGMHNYCG